VLVAEELLTVEDDSVDQLPRVPHVRRAQRAVETSLQHARPGARLDHLEVAVVAAGSRDAERGERHEEEHAA